MTHLKRSIHKDITHIQQKNGLNESFCYILFNIIENYENVDSIKLREKEREEDENTKKIREKSHCTAHYIQNVISNSTTCLIYLCTKNFIALLRWNSWSSCSSKKRREREVKMVILGSDDSYACITYTKLELFFFFLHWRR